MMFCFLVAPRKEKVVRLNSGIADRELPLNYSCFKSDQDSVTGKELSSSRLQAEDDQLKTRIHSLINKTVRFVRKNFAYCSNAWA